MKFFKELLFLIGILLISVQCFCQDERQDEWIEKTISAKSIIDTLNVRLTELKLSIRSGRDSADALFIADKVFWVEEYTRTANNCINECRQIRYPRSATNNELNEAVNNSIAMLQMSLWLSNAYLDACKTEIHLAISIYKRRQFYADADKLLTIIKSLAINDFTPIFELISEGK